MKDLGFGAVGVGQAGINISSHFAKHYPTVIIDTAPQNLKDCKVVKKDLKFHAAVNSWGGAGKRADIGEQAIEENADEIADLLETNLSNCTFVWVIAGLGGGTGSAGHLIVSNILDYLGIPHGLFVTLPDESQEGIDEIINAYIALGKIEEARQRFDYLSSVIIIENQKLRNQVMKESKVNFEKTWEEANKYIFDRFYQLFEYSQRESSHSFDGQDYLRILEKTGYMMFGEKIVENVGEASENVLVNEVKDTWQDNIFVDNLNFNQAKGLGIVIDRPESYSTDGRAIDNLLSTMKDFIGVGTICTGIYETKEGLKDKIFNSEKNPLKIMTVISGMPFPHERFKELEEMALQNDKEYTNKEQEQNVEIKIDQLSSIFDSNLKKENKKRKRKSFSVFSRGKSKKQSKKVNLSEKLKERKQQKEENWEKNFKEERK